MLPSLLLLAVWAQADDFWKKKPSSDWTAKEALKLLKKSPWAREQTVLHLPYRQGLEVSTTIPLGGNRTSQPRSPDMATAAYIRATYLVRWESASPITQARARLGELGEQARADSLAPPPRLPEDRYVITVLMTGPPEAESLEFHHRDFFDGLDEFELKQRARLKTKRGTVAPLAVERSRVGFLTPIHFYFPRTYKGKPLLRSEREVETVEFRVKGKMFTLKSKFTLALHYLR